MKDRDLDALVDRINNLKPNERIATMVKTLKKPTDLQIRKAFHATAKAVMKDFYESWLEDVNDLDTNEVFTVSRESIADWLHEHGDTYGQRVYNWCMHMTNTDFHNELDAAGVKHVYTRYDV